MVLLQKDSNGRYHITVPKRLVEGLSRRQLEDVKHYIFLGARTFELIPKASE